MHGGAADRSGLIFPGDEVVEVNGVSVEGKTPDDVLQMLKNSEGTITFKIKLVRSRRRTLELDFLCFCFIVSANCSGGFVTT